MPKLKHSVVQKSYQCEFCQVKCRRPQDLRRHLFVHTEASFQCDGCGNKFTRYDTLMRHKRDNCRNSQSVWTERHRHVKQHQQRQEQRQQQQQHSLTKPQHERSIPESEKPILPPLVTDPINTSGSQFQFARRPVSPPQLLTARSDSPISYQHYEFRPTYTSAPIGLKSMSTTPPPISSPSESRMVPPISPYHHHLVQAPTHVPPTAPGPQVWQGYAVNSAYGHSMAITPITPMPQTTPSPISTCAHTASPRQSVAGSYPECDPLDMSVAIPPVMTHSSWIQPSTPPQEALRELPRLVKQNGDELMAKRGLTLQPLEPRPIRFGSEGAPKFPLPRNDRI